jgi:hypothetical protein
VVSSDTRTGAAVAVAVEQVGGSGIGGEANLAGWEADPMIVSPLDGSLRFQLRGEPPPGESGVPTQWLLHRGRLSRWHPTGGAVEWTAGAFDPVDGCFLFAGSAASARPGSALVVHRICGIAEESWRLAALPGALSAARLLGVAAVAREPGSGRVVLAVTAEENRQGAPRRLHGLLRLNEDDGTLEPLGQLPFPTEITALAADNLRGRLLVGTAGDGVLAWRQGRLAPFATDSRVAAVTALEDDPRRDSFTAATPQGLVRLGADGTVEQDLVFPPEPGLSLDALPMAVAPQGDRVLFSSHRAGLAELARRPGASWFLTRRWLAGDDIPGGSYGPAVYEAGGGIASILRSRGLVRIEKEGWTLLGTDAGLAAPDLLNLLALRSGALWVAVGASPFAPAGQADLQAIEGDRVTASYELGRARGGAIGDLLEMADRGTVWAATALGVLEVGRDGSPQRLSQYATTALARDPRTGAVGAVGSTIERWESGRFVPVLFRIDHPRAVAGGYAPGHPVGLAIDSAGRWVLLYSNGVIVLLDATGSFLGVLDAEDGIPPTSRRLLAVPAAREVLVGSGHEGTVSLADPLP